MGIHETPFERVDGRLPDDPWATHRQREAGATPISRERLGGTDLSRDGDDRTELG